MNKENLKSKNSFCSPESRSAGLDFSDDTMESYQLIDAYIPGPTKDDTDFVTFKKPKLIDKWKQNKRVAAESKGMDLKSIIARVQKTGDASILSPREVVYGDERLVPKSKSDQMQQAINTEKFLDSLSASKKEELIRVSKLSKEEYAAYLKSEFQKLYPTRKEEKKKEGESL